MSLNEYEDFVYGACLPAEGDAAEFWRAFSARQQRVIDWLKGKKEVHIKGPETDLRFDVTGRTFINCDGKFNMPDGEVFTGPVSSLGRTARLAFHIPMGSAWRGQSPAGRSHHRTNIPRPVPPN